MDDFPKFMKNKKIELIQNHNSQMILKGMFMMESMEVKWLYGGAILIENQKNILMILMNIQLL